MHKNIKVRLAFNLLERLSNSMFTPFLAVFLANIYGNLVAGLLMMVIIGFALGGNYISGALSDARGRKGLLVLADLSRGCILIIGPLIYLMYNESHFIIYIAVLCVTVFGGISSPVFNAMIIDVTNGEERKTVYTLLYWFTNIGLTIGVLLGGMLFEEYFAYCLIISGMVYTIVGIVTLFFLEETITSVDDTIQSSIFSFKKNLGQYKQVLKDKRFLIITFSSLCFVLIENQLSNYLSIKIANSTSAISIFGLNFNGVGVFSLLQAENTVIAVVGSLLILKSLNKLFKGRYLALTLVFFSLGYFCLAYFNNFTILVIAMLVASIAEIIVMPAVNTAVSNTIPKEQAGLYSAVLNQLMALGIIISSSLISLSSYLSNEMMALVILFMGALGIYLYAIHSRDNVNSIQTDGNRDSNEQVI